MREDVAVKRPRSLLRAIDQAVVTVAGRDVDRVAELRRVDGVAVLREHGHLDGILHAKGFMGKRDDSEFRACAAMALGKINTTKSMECLNRAKGEKDVIVRNAVSRAIRGGGS